MTCAAVPECRALATHLLTPGRRRRRRHLVSIDSVTSSRRIASLIIHARCHHTTQAHGDANNDISPPRGVSVPLLRLPLPLRAPAPPHQPLTLVINQCSTRRILRFCSKTINMTFTFLWSCCTRFLEPYPRPTLNLNRHITLTLTLSFNPNRKPNSKY